MVGKQCLVNCLQLILISQAINIILFMTNICVVKCHIITVKVSLFSQALMELVPILNVVFQVINIFYSASFGHGADPQLLAFLNHSRPSKIYTHFSN